MAAITAGQRVVPWTFGGNIAVIVDSMLVGDELVRRTRRTRNCAQVIVSALEKYFVDLFSYLENVG